MHPTIHFLVLGCPKSQVDGERMAALAERLGYTLVADPEQADVTVVNTCGFIDAAKQESIDATLLLAEGGNRGRLVLAGCLSQRYAAELADELPEVDHLIGAGDLQGLERILSAPEDAPRLAVAAPDATPERSYPRRLDPGVPWAYLKLAEGCDRRCAFCTIPAIRGRQRSRRIASLVAEATSLVEAGARELVLVAQDTTAYGRDLRPRASLVSLLAALDAIPAVAWIRLMYTYPTEIDRHLLQAIAALPRVAPYIDVPIQHVDDRVLRRMQRGYGGRRIRELAREVREIVPRAHLRTTVLTGHPGETEAAHRDLLQLVEEVGFDHLGAFAFSPEEGTLAAEQPDQVPREVAKARAAEVMELQRRISRERLATLRGRTLDVLVEGTSPESDYLMQGRHAGQAPEVDGVVVLTSCTAAPGDIIQAVVTDSADYDLVAHPA